MSRFTRPAIHLAEQQRGVIARFQLRRWLTEGQIDGKVHRRELIPLERGVYRVEGGASLAEQRAFATQLRIRPPATLSGPLVLGCLGVEGFTTGHPFEVLIPPGRRLRGIDRPVRIDPVPDRPVSRCGEVRLTSPADALLDAARWREELGDRALRIAYDTMRWRGLVTSARIEELLEQRAPTDAGAAALYAVLDGEVRSESEGERRLRPVLSRFDPAPEPQVWVTPRRRVDWYFRPVKVAVEYLGGVDHAYAAGRAADDVRDAELAEQSIRVLYVTDADLHDPDTVLASVAGLLALRAAASGATAPAVRGGLPAPVGA